MAENEAAELKPLWLSIEEKIQAVGLQALSGDKLEASIQKIAGDLDNAGYNVSRLGGNMLELRWAVAKAQEVGKPLMDDLKKAITAFTLDDLADTYGAANGMLDNLGKTWPVLIKAANRPDVIGLVQAAKLDLLVAKAKGLADDAGIRLLIEEKIEDEVIIPAMDISAEKLAEVHAAVAAELAERKRIMGLVAAVDGKTDEEKVRHLFENDVAEELILSVAGLSQAAIDGAKAAMEAEIAEKKRLAEEAAAKKKAEAEGPAIEDMSPEEIAEHIYAIREIQEFSDQEKEIRTMCEQSAIPKALVDLSINDPAKFEELEKETEG